MIYTNFYDNFPLNRKEIYRYLGYRIKENDFDSVDSVLEECLKEVEKKCSFKVCYSYFPIFKQERGMDLTFCYTESSDLKKNLEGCNQIVIFAATIGFEIDRLIEKYSKLSIVKSLIFQAIGAERVETLCDFFNTKIKEEFSKKNLYLHPRFSPGYGDCPIQMQKDFFKALDCERKLGLTLNESFLMAPSKSVTAIIGISNRPYGDKRNGCYSCLQKNCTFRNGDK